ncbi:MAG: hypothetical protein K1X87_03920 [Dehalococcoidia bacterium]|nr:hypothetical protein [Dehalococcoidia bacterium]
MLGGFTLAVALPAEAALGRFGTGWFAHAQVHGHLQVIGFAGLFVVGVSTRLAPRFTNRTLHDPSIRVAFWLLASGLFLRALGQPLAQHAAFAAVMLIGGALEAAGALLALVTLTRTLRPWAAPRSASAALLNASAFWLTVQALLSLWWLRDLAVEGDRILPADRNALLLEAQTFGFLLSALAGVGLRSFPTFFGAPPPPSRYAWGFAAVLQAGLVVWLLGLGLQLDAGGAVAVRLATAGQLLLGTAVAAIAVLVGWWRHGSRLAPASRHFIWSLRAIAASLTLTGVLLALSAARALVEDVEVTNAQLDAIRHVFLIGVITLAIVVMGQLILPEFASERLVRQPAQWRGRVFAVALPLAAVFRGVLPLAGLSGEARYWSMSIGGLLGLASVIAFAVLYWRARQNHRTYLARVAGWRGREVPLA